MMIMTAKVDFKKIMVILLSVAALLLALILVLGNQSSSEQTSATVSANEGRVKFLQDFGWDVAPTPKEATQVRIPAEDNEMFRRYNALQKGQGYDLSKFSGKKAMRYVYEVRNYPSATAPVYATLLVYRNSVIGGDVTDTAVNGKIRGFQMPVIKEPSPTAESPTNAGEESKA